jgi:hypothetical protein
MQGEFPLELLVTTEFKEENGKTTMTLTHYGMPGGEVGEMANTSWNEMFDKLAENLPSSK